MLPKYRTIVEVNGCFWHQHPGCRFAYMPDSNRSFWRRKLSGNRSRDLRNWRELRKLGWRVIVVWECEATRQARLDRLVRQIKAGVGLRRSGWTR